MCLDECSGGHRVVDVGCGAGVAIPNLRDIYLEVYGVDVKPVGSFLRASVYDLPFDNGECDTVFTVSTLEHLTPSKLPAAFQEMSRVLRDGGQIVYGVPKASSLMTFAFHLLGCDIKQHHFSTEQEVYLAAKSSGLTEVSRKFMKIMESQSMKSAILSNDRLRTCLLLAVGSCISIYFWNYQAMMAPDFVSFIETGRALWHFNLPSQFVRGPVFGLLVYPLVDYLAIRRLSCCIIPFSTHFPLYCLNVWQGFGFPRRQP